MATKKKSLLTTDNTTLPTITPPAFANIVSFPFAYSTAISPNTNVRNIPVVPDTTNPTRPSQNVGFDISITDLTQPKPMYRNDINGIFNLYSGILSDLCSGIPVQYDPRYIANRVAINSLTPPPIQPIPTGYPLGAILFSNTAWYQSLVANNITDPAITTATPYTWQQITIPYINVGNSIGGITYPATSLVFLNSLIPPSPTNPTVYITPYIEVADSDTSVDATEIQFVGATVTQPTPTSNTAVVTITPPTPPPAVLQLFQQGRLTGVPNGKPYGDTSSDGSPLLYFTPTEQGNLISLWNGTAWVTQSLPTIDLQLIVSSLSGNYDIYVGYVAGVLTLIPVAWTNSITTQIPSPRTQQDGRWVSGSGATIDKTKLLLGSIIVSNNSSGNQVVQSWSGYRGIFNVYNQIPLIGQAYIYNGGNSWTPPANTDYQTFALPTPLVTNAYGTKKIGILIDPLVKSVMVRYSGQTYSYSAGGQNRFSVSFGIDDTTPTHPLIQIVSAGIIRGGATTESNVVNTIEFEFNIPDVTAVPVSNDTTTINNGFTDTNIVGFNDINRLESSGYAPSPAAVIPAVSASDNKGLTVEYLG